MAQTVVVTGAGGFVGLPLCTLLARAGTEVRAAVRRECAPLAELAAQSRLRQVIVGDIGDEATDWSATLAGADAVVHLAARVHVPGPVGAEDHDHFRKINVDASLRLVQAAARARVRRIVLVSSAKVGDGQDAYSRSKRDAERLLREATQASGVECVIVRPPLVYGPRVRANFLRLLRVVGSGIPLPLASVANHRSLVYVGNLADALQACIAHPSAAGQIFAVSDGEDVSTPELVRRIAGALGRPARLFPFPVALLALAGRLAGQAQTIGRLTEDLVVDSAPIRALLGWRPPFSMAQGLTETAAWYRMRRRPADPC
jgi:nucleoside-diphosphate-sugar epimerase